MVKRYKKICFDIFPEFKILVWFGCSREDFFSDITAMYGENDFKCNAKGMSIMEEISNRGKTIIQPILFIEGYDYEVLAHEAVHMASDLMEANGIKEVGSEILALLVECIVRKVRKEFKVE